MRIGTRVTIHRSIREVFDFVSAPENLPLWTAGVAAATRTRPGPIGVGATFETTHAPGGRPRTNCWEIIEHEPPRAFAYRHLDWGAFIQCRYTLEGVDGCTGLGLEVDGGAGLSGAPAPLPRRSARRLEADLGRLRDVLERGFREEGRGLTVPLMLLAGSVLLAAAFTPLALAAIALDPTHARAIPSRREAPSLPASGPQR